MNIRCRPITPADFGRVESEHWASARQVEEFAHTQGLASVLAFDDDRYLGQLYAREYDAEFVSRGGWEDHWPWADFRAGRPLELPGKYLTLGCYHVGWSVDGKTRDPSLLGRGIGTALLEAAIDWFTGQSRMDGLLTWAVSPGSKELLQRAGQMPWTVYDRHGFRLIKEVLEPGWTDTVASFTADTPEVDLTLLRVMALD